MRVLFQAARARSVYFRIKKKGGGEDDELISWNELDWRRSFFPVSLPLSIQGDPWIFHFQRSIHSFDSLRAAPSFYTFFFALLGFFFTKASPQRRFFASKWILNFSRGAAERKYSSQQYQIRLDWRFFHLSVVDTALIKSRTRSIRLKRQMFRWRGGGE